MFMAAYLFNIISTAMCEIFVRCLSEAGEAYMAVVRLQTFLEYGERSIIIESEPDQKSIMEEMETRNIANSLKNATAEWSAVAGMTKYSKKSKNKVLAYNNSTAKKNQTTMNKRKKI